MKSHATDQSSKMGTCILLLICICTRPSAALTIGGRVVNEKGEAINGVEVEVCWFDSPGHGMSEECTTNAQGQWQVELPEGVRDVDIHLDHPGYISDESYRKEKPPMSRLRDGTSVMVMKRGLEIKGIVRSNDGKPVANALILPHGRYATAAAGAAVEDSTTARTAADGRFVLTGLGPGPRELTITATGFGPESVPVDVTPDMAPVEVTMRPGGTFQGRVADEDGQPIEGAGVYCRRWEMRRSHIVSLTARTDAAGHFKISDAPLDGSLEFYVSKKGFLLPEDTVYLPQREPYEITLYRPPVISGTVVDEETGKPITEFEVTDGILWPSSSKVYWRGSETVHSEHGAFSRTIQNFIVKPSLPSYAVRIMAKGYAPETTPLVQVGEKAEPSVVRLHKGEPWTGIVNDSAGRPVVNANVAWIGPDHRAFVENAQIQLQYAASPEWVVRTDSGGHFELPPSKTEGWILALHETGYGWWHSRRFVRNSTVRLTAWAHIEGIVRIPGLDNHTIQLKMELVENTEETEAIPIQWSFTENSHIDGRFAFDYVPSIPLAIGHVLEEKFFLGRYVTPQPGQDSKLELTAEGPKPVSVASLVGKLLPPFEGIEIDFATEKARGKMLLVCFWNMNQRPSRNCIVQLAKQAQQLKRKGITIVAVQASKVDENVTDEWAKKNDIPFAVGTVEDDAEKIRFAWGVRSLPWLVLTDGQHVVVAEGFAVNELDERIRSAQK